MQMPSLSLSNSYGMTTKTKNKDKQGTPHCLRSGAYRQSRAELKRAVALVRLGLLGLALQGGGGHHLVLLGVDGAGGVDDALDLCATKRQGGDGVS